MTHALAVVFFLSGSAALLFESLWFRQTLLAFGSSVVASSLVLSSFMAGLALGNALAARFGTRVKRPITLYAKLEVGVGLLGLALVWGLPRLGPLLAPVFGSAGEAGAGVATLRFAMAFVLLVGPAAAMGATLPLLVRALTRSNESFGRILGSLYGWNTAGAVCGALVGELFLIHHLGVLGSGFAAAGLNLLAAVGAFALARGIEAPGASDAGEEDREGEGETGMAWRGLSLRAQSLLLASFLAGAVHLALQAAWYRMILLFVAGTARAFAVMLAIVLSGIALGGFAGSRWLARDPHAGRHAFWVALFAAAAGATGYHLMGLGLVDPDHPRVVIDSLPGLVIALSLMFPISLASGLLFTLLGNALNDALHVPVRSAGLLTLVNTLGAATGPLVAGFFLVPRFGSEATLFGLCAAYLVIATLAFEWGRTRFRPLGVAAAAVLVGGLLAFPFGRWQNQYVPFVLGSQLIGSSQLVAEREGLIETIHITQSTFLGEPVSQMLITDGYPMSNSGTNARRYMNLFVELPAALHPGLERALLISYGVGNTAHVLTRTPGVREIDVVDISQDILDMSEVFFPDPATNPLRDERVRIHVEDGRYFMQATDRRYDLITGEPPPPNIGNVTYLYTQEYFQLAHDRLNEGGLVSYWLPVEQLQLSETGAIAGAFCNVFADCTLWNGGNLNWVLLGSRGGIDAVHAEDLGRLWRDERAREDLFDVGIESPEALGALFLADAEQLSPWTRAQPPVTDDFPTRIHNWLSPTVVAPYVEFSDAAGARTRFIRSRWVKDVWPESMRVDTQAQFRLTRIGDRAAGHLATPDFGLRLSYLRNVLEASDRRVLPQRLLYGDPRALAVARAREPGGVVGSEHAFILAQGALGDRDFAAAARYLEQAHAFDANSEATLHLAAYSWCRAGARAELDALRARLFAAAAGREAAASLGREFVRNVERNPGVDGCWQAAWQEHGSRP